MVVSYKCFKCGKKITNPELTQRFVCTKCGSKIFYKPRTVVKTIKAE